MKPAGRFERVLVTGGGGFIGRRLTARLRAEGLETAAPDRAALDVAAGPPDLEPFDHVFHLAGLSGVPRSWLDPAGFCAANVQGTVNMLEYCRRVGCGMTFAGGYPYGTPERLPIAEDAPRRPNNPYALTQAMAEDACVFYAREFALPIQSLRVFNIYGPGQSPGFLIPDVVAQVLDPTVEEIVVADLAPRRDYLFVEDAVEGMILAARTAAAGVFNLGGGRSYSVEEAVDAAQAAAGTSKPRRQTGKSRPNEIPDVVADVAALRRRCGWAPRTPFAEGVARVVDAARAPSRDPVRAPSSDGADR